MDNLLLVDGNNLLFQMFYGMPARIFNKSGKAVHASIGFVGALLKIIKMVKPTHVAVLFDGEHENARSALNSDYKANRIDYTVVPELENPFSQLNDIYKVLDYMGIKHAETTVCETDDWIAGYALTYGKDMQINIASFDSDFFQLITNNVSIIRYRGIKTAICTPDYILNNFGISPAQYADYKSLVGDNADNIKGAEKVGPKTASKLLKQFGNLDNLVANASKIEKPSIRESIIKNTKNLQTNYKLIKLNNYTDLPFKLSELRYNFNNSTTTEILKNVGLLP